VTVIVVGPAEALSRGLEDGADGLVVIDGSTDEAIWATLVALQTAYASRVGRIVLVLPTVGIVGAAGAVDYTTSIEGIRAMAKSAARQWGSDGIAVNVVAAPAHLFARDVEASHLSAAAVPEDDTLIRQIVATANFLLRTDLPHLTGETIVVDGGSVMLP